ncbi:MAG: hypothetical protein ACLGI8_13750 [Acidimicrobiia bacterium]|jgi:hypothetical protein
MSTFTESIPRSVVVDTSARITRKTIDRVLTLFGVVLTLALVVAGALLMWGASFSADYVDDELSSQNITFPPAEALAEEGRDDLVKYGGEVVNTGPEAEAYASFINGHLEGIADGATYAELGTPEREAKAALDAAKESGASEAEIAKLEGEYNSISGQRNTLFKGETLRGLLLSAYAWATVGQIAFYAAIGAFVAAAAMAVLTVFGFRHMRKLEHQEA